MSAAPSRWAALEARYLRLLEGLADVAHRRYRLVFLITAVVVVLSVAASSRIQVDTDVLSLLPPSDPVVRAFRETVAEFGSTDLLLVAVRLPEDAVVDPYFGYVDELAAALRELPEIEYVEHRVGDVEELLAAFLPKSMLFLDEAAREQIAARVDDAGLRRRAAELRRQASSPLAPGIEPLLRLDPLGLTGVLLGSMQGARGVLAVDWQSGYFLSQDRRLLLLLAKPIKPPQDVDFDAVLVAAVEGAVARVGEGWAEMAGDDAGPPPDVALGGGYLIALDDASLIRRDMVLNVSTSLGTVLPLFWYAFRRVRTLLYAVVPLAVGIALTGAVSALTIGTVSAATTGVAALLVGMAIDFVFVSYGRYVEERRRGAPIDEAMRVMGGTAGRGVVTGAVTTTATFYAFFVTDFRGLREMGFLTGTGILLCVGAVLVLLPALLGWTEARQARRRGEDGDETMPTDLVVHGLGVERVIAGSLKAPRAVLCVSAALTLVLGVLGWRVGFVDSIQNLRPKGNRGVLVEDEVLRHFGSDFEQMMIVLHGDSAEDVVAQADRAAAGADRLVREGVLAGSASIAALVPSPERQRTALEWLERERAGRLDAVRVRSTFEEALRAEGLRPEAFARGLDLFDAAVATDRPITLDDLAASEEASRLADRYVRETKNGWRSVVYLYPPPKIWKRKAPPEVVTLAESLGPKASLVGVNVVSDRLRVRVRHDAIVAALIGAAAIAVLLAFDFRRVAEAALASIPLLVGLVWMVGTMVLLGMELNFMSIFVVTMIIGIGIDYGIHVVHRYRDEEARGGDVSAGVGETAKAVLLASLGTIFGFGSMVTSHYPALQSIGYVAILGTSACAIVAVTTLPAALHLLARRRQVNELRSSA